jgi:hypothetical protein
VGTGAEEWEVAKMVEGLKEVIKAVARGAAEWAEAQVER